MKSAWVACVLWIAGLAISIPAVGVESVSGTNKGGDAMTESSRPAAGGCAPAGAAPPLAYQIRHSASIVLCSTEVSGGAVSYRVREVWETAAPGFKAGESMPLDTRMHELLGYRPRAGQDVLLFFTAKGLPSNQPIELMPVVDGEVTYSPHDKSVQEKLTLAQLKQRIAGGGFTLPDVIPKDGMEIPLRVSFTGLKSVRWLALAHNNLAPLLVLFDDHLLQRVIFKTSRKYTEIEYVDVSVTDTENLDIAYRDSGFSFGCKLKVKQDLIAVLKFFQRKGVKLGETAQRLLDEADRK